MLHDKQLFNKVPVQWTKYRKKKNCVWTTSRLSEMCIVPHGETKSVFTFQPIKRLVSMTVRGAKPVAMFWIFLLGTKNRQLCCFVVMEHIALQERRVATTNDHLIFWRKFSANHNQAHPNVNQKRANQVQIWNKRCVSYWLMIWARYSIFKSFCSISIYC